MPAEMVKKLRLQGYRKFLKPASGSNRPIFIHPDLFQDKKPITLKQALRAIPNHEICLDPGETNKITFLGQDVVISSPTFPISVVDPWYNTPRHNI